MSAETLNTLIDILLKVYIVTVMFAMGLTLTTTQIREQVRRTSLMLKAMLANLVIVPLAAFVLINLSSQPEAVIVAMVLVACAPGYAPIASAYAKGDLAFTAVLMFVLSVVSVITLPLTASLMFAGQGGITLDPWSVIQTLLTLQVIPLLLGMVVKRLSDQIAGRLLPIFSIIARIAIVVSLGLVLVLFFGEITNTIWVALILMVALAFIALFAGYLLGGPTGETRRTLALNTVVRNLGLALLIASSQFSGLGAELVVIAYAFIMYAAALIITYFWSREVANPV